MKATISVSRLKNGAENLFEASYNGEKWECEDDLLQEFLNVYSANWQLQGYHPNPIIGTAAEVAAALADTLKAQFVGAEEINYSEFAENVQF